MALTGAQVKQLRSMAHHLNPAIIIGKSDVNEGTVEQTVAYLEKHELVKCSVLDGSSLSAREAADILCEALDCECVQVIGRKFVLFKQKKKGKRLHRRAGKMRTLLYGGTFDPPHNGHLNNLRAAAARVRPDRVVVMPAGLSPLQAVHRRFRQRRGGDVRVLPCTGSGGGCPGAVCQRLGGGAGRAGQAQLHGAHAGNAGPAPIRKPSCTWPWAVICC